MSAAEADRALKKKHRAMWASGDYPMLAAELIPQLGPMLVQAAGITAGQRVLDVAAGSGNASIPAALTGAQVVASDLTPELLAAGRRLAARAGAKLTWQEADAEALPFTDGEFDVVISCVGVMFAPRHQAAANELVRVCRPGGRIALIAWTPAGFVGQMFATMKAYAPPPPPGAQPPPLWGDPEHVSALLADRVSGFTAERRTLRIDRFAEPAAMVDYYKTYYGPTIAVYRTLVDHPERAAALDRDLIDLVRGFDRGGSRVVVDLEYLVIMATRRC
jgi:SAM-dependent methyltransferase